MTRRIEFTVKEYARIERVTTRTVRVWISKGALEVRKTPGGGVRILRLVKNDEVLGSPSH